MSTTGAHLRSLRTGHESSATKLDDVLDVVALGVLLAFLLLLAIVVL